MTPRTWCHDHPPAEVQVALERLGRAEDVVRVAAMPDVHLAKDVCVGAVVATRQILYPAAVGGDIGCGMAAVRLTGDAALLDSKSAARAVFEGFGRHVPVMRHGDARDLPSHLDVELSSRGLSTKKNRVGRLQLGTLGSGNHFLEVQADEGDGLWLMVHSGSRGMGQAIRDHHVDRGERRKGGLVGLDADSETGRDYLHDVGWALDYAEANRDRILRGAARVLTEVLGLRCREGTFISCHHNHVRRERFDGTDELWGHRKGAISARDGEPGIIPGSMGSASFHVEGRGCSEALFSSSHGAGRVLSRSAARSRVTVEDLRLQMRGVWFDDRLTHRLRDEAPSAYKDIGNVMKAQRELTRVVRRLRPILVYKGA